MKLFNNPNVKKEKTPLYMKIVDVLKPFYINRGADFEQLRLIVSTKMIMDRRNTNPTSDFFESGSKKKESNTFFSSLWFYGLLSTFFLFIFTYDSYMFQYTTYFSYLFTMLIATLIAQFSSIILDSKDQSFIGTKPILPITTDLAKSTHIGIYLVAFTSAIGIGPIVGSFIFNGFWVGLLTVLLTGLAAVWSLIITLMAYAFILRRFDGERLKNMIAYFQIIFSVFMVLSFYIMGSLFELVNIEALAVNYSLSWWHIFIFPLWFVSPFGLIQEGSSISLIILFVLLILGSLVLVVLYQKNSNRIDQNLQKISSGSNTGTRRNRLAHLFSKILFISRNEKPYYFFAWNIARSDRDFKTRLYPSLVTAILMPLIFIWSFLQNIDYSALIDTNLFAYVPYFLVLIIPTLSVSLSFSSSPKASWIFTVRPFNNLGRIFRGIYKALLVRLIFPLYLLISLIMIILSKGLNFFILVNGFLMLGIIFYLNMYFSLSSLPFVEPYDPGKANMGCIAGAFVFMTMAVVTILFAVVQTFVPFGKIGLFILLFIVTTWIHRRGFNRKKLEKV